MKRGRTPWQFSISVFKEFKGCKGDSKRVITRCFESDFAKTCIPRVLKDNM